LLKFFGFLILGTRYKFGKRSDLWAAEARNRLLYAPAFGEKTGMSRNIFYDVWNALVFSDQGDSVDGESSIEYRWRLVDDFFEAINSHRAANYTPSELICDESISRWYGQGGSWIEHGLPHYVAIDRKPEYRCEVQNAACRRSGVMIQLQLVTTAEHEHGRRLQMKQVFSTVRPCLTGY
jgi:hypothetical protein